jgi:hypothetical protein
MELEKHLTGVSNPKYCKQWETTLAQYAYPSIGEKTVQSITVAEINDILRPI